MVWSPLVLSLSLAAGSPVEAVPQPVVQTVSVTAADCAAPMAPACEVTCPSACGDSSCCGNDGCCWYSPCCKPCRPGKWNDPCKYGTCDLYPHFAYRPESHGYYYFRPYNWMHYDQHRQALPGTDWKFPHSNKPFASIEKSFAEAGKTGTANSDQVAGVIKSLPKVEAILKASKEKK